MIAGYTSFTGGLDQSREPNLIGETSYAHAVNVYIPFYSDRAKTRPGIHAVALEFPGDRDAANIYASGHIQGSGSYTYRGDTFHIKVIDGWVFEFCEVRNNVMQGRRRNIGFQNNPERTKAWVTEIPGGAIIQDGESLPIYLQPGEARRTRPQDKEIGVGRMMTFVQNRLFYVNEDSNFIYASDYGNPISLRDAYANNIFGFATPDASDRITAIGFQKGLSRDINGGELVFSTRDAVYSADVRGALSDWGTGDGIGVARLMLSGVGAVSPYSFTNFNTNLWFRSPDGIVGFKQNQFQFVNEDSVLNSSIEVQPTLERDTPWALDQCQSVNWKNRLITTTAPAINEDGYVFWQGMMVMSPNPKVRPDTRAVDKRYESIWTGVRPWSLSPQGDKLFIDSHDVDGFNRMYVMSEDFTYDKDSTGQIVEIEGFIETRSFDFKSRFQPKRMSHRQLGLYGLYRDVELRSSAREGAYGNWRAFDQRTFKVKTNCDHEGAGWDTSNYQPQSRQYVRLPSEGRNEEPAIGDSNGDTFLDMQYRFDFRGHLEFGEMVVEAKEESPNMSTTPEETEKTGLIYTPTSDYKYSIHHA